MLMAIHPVVVEMFQPGGVGPTDGHCHPKTSHIWIISKTTQRFFPVCPCYVWIVVKETIAKREFIKCQSQNQVRVQYREQSVPEQGRWEEGKEKTCLPFLPVWVEGDSLAAV